MPYQVNLGLQVIPITDPKDAYSIIDDCIKIIQSSKLAYQVTPFETVIEGGYDEIMMLIKDIYEFSITKTKEVVINIRLHSKADQDVIALDKIQKFNE